MASPSPPLTVLVLAAGMGTRMRSERIKLLHELAGRSMIEYVMETVDALRPRQSLAVVGYQAEQVMEKISDLCDGFVMQKSRRGTGHAVREAIPSLEETAEGQFLILNGDLPTLRPSTLRALLSRHRRSGAALTLLTARLQDATGYGRIVRSPGGGIARIVEDRDASPKERKINECNAGIYCADPGRFIPVLNKLRADNVQGEYYITDAVHKLIASGEKVVAVCHNDAEEVLGVNNRKELARAARVLYRRKADRLQKGGVTILDDSRTWIDPRSKIGKDTIIYPDVIIEGSCAIGKDCIIRPGTRIVDSKVGAGTEIKDHSVILQSSIGRQSQVGPFAHLRPGSRLDADVRVGNFVEVKKSRLREGVKASHLSYIGDADIGEASNIGAGTITCNYDGENKLPTVLGKGVFIGSDTQLVAPVTIGENAYVGAGTTVTKDVPDGALAISRAGQTNIEGWVEKRRRRSRKKGGKG